MKARSFFIMLCFIYVPLALFAKDKPTLEGVEGYWMVVEKKKPTSIMAVYKYQDKIYGKILVSYTKQGIFTTDNPNFAEKLEGKPKMQGIDIVWGGAPESDAKKDETRWKDARILDPRGPKLYRAEFYRLGAELKIRGSLMSISWLGKNMTWYPVNSDQIPEGYKLPALSTLRPNVPEEFLQK